MLTGIVKLAQIDDYISPSQNCIQPKIMKLDAAKQKATVTLNDCLACSGCITSAETILIEQMSIEKFIQITKSNDTIAVMIAPQTLLSLAKFYEMQPEEFFNRINLFFTSYFKSVVGVFQMATAIKICHELIIQEFMQKIQKKETPVLCSQCPGWVCYSQKTLTQKITSLMSQVKSPQQIMSHLLKQKYGKNCRIVSIMPCYDKKLEAIRFQLEQKIKQVDLTIATIQFVQLVKKIQATSSEPPVFTKLIKEQISQKCQEQQQNCKVECNSQKCKSECKKERKCECTKGCTKESKSECTEQLPKPPSPNSQLTFTKDPTSNGYIEFILARLQIKDYTCQQVKNSSDYKQYTFNWKGSEVKMAKCYGFKNIQKIVQMVKKDKCPYAYVEVMACPGGCFGGGGQVRYEGVKNKDLITGFEKTLHNYQIISGQRQKQKIEEFGIDVQKLYFKYKPIEKNLTQAVLNW